MARRVTARDRACYCMPAIAAGCAVVRRAPSSNFAAKRLPNRTQPMISCTIRTRRPALFVPLLAALAAVALAQQRVCPISDL